MKKRDLLHLLILISLSACTSAPTVPARTTTVTGSDVNSSAPDLSRLDRETRQSIETACVGEFTRGPAPYRKCVEQHLESIGGMGDSLAFSSLDKDMRQSPVGARVETAWEFQIEGSGTPFETRWANADPLIDESSAGAMLGFAGIRADEGDLDLYIEDPYPAADILLSALAGEELECDFENWRLAVDRQEFRIADSSRSTDNSATFLQPQDVKAFWQAFVAGSLLAVQFERTCDGDMNEARMVYSLVGSRAAVEHVLN